MDTNQPAKDYEGSVTVYMAFIEPSVAPGEQFQLLKPSSTVV